MQPMNQIATMQPRNMQMMFGNIEQIFTVNCEFLYALTHIDDIRNVSAFMELFVSMGEKFMCYIPYCSNQQSNSTKLIKTFLTKGEVKAFLDVYSLF